jgi:GNAT superfamily N-acetyltransferase
MGQVDIHRFTPDDTDDVLAAMGVRNAVAEADAPWEHPLLLPGYEGVLRHGWDGEPDTPYLMTEDGVPVGVGGVSVTERDNLHLAWLAVRIHPDHRRRGLGGMLLDCMVAEAKALGRTSVGTDAWESAGNAAFAERHGFEPRSRAIQRRQHLAEISHEDLQRMYDDAAAHAADYDLVRIVGRTPAPMVEAMAELVSAINDAPTDDLDIEDEVFTAERLVAYEDATLARDKRLYRLVARHKGTGELAGHTVIGVENARPAVGEQDDTAVARAHRGHRLGLLLKAGMLLWLAEVEPQLQTVDTWNAESNDHMIAVNEALGYRVMGREIQYQKTV